MSVILTKLTPRKSCRTLLQEGVSPLSALCAYFCRRGSVLIVSHRLQHLPSLCHRVGVVGEGQLLEFAPPRSLLRDKHSRFHALYAAARGAANPESSSNPGTPEQQQ